MGILQAGGVALLGAMLILLLREMRAPMATPVRLVTALALFCAAMGLYTPVLARITALFSLGDGGEFAAVVLRAVGVGVIAELCATLCRDLGEGTLAEGVLLFGKLEILVLALPLVDDLMEIAGELLK